MFSCDLGVGDLGSLKILGVSLSQTLHVCHIYAYIDPQNHPNVACFCVFVRVSVPLTSEDAIDFDDPKASPSTLDLGLP